MKTMDFISSLPSIPRFQDLSDLTSFSPAPEDWRLYSCDIVNSTQAIEVGRYKAVNMAGAACIMAAINAAAGTEIAYVFGGDGATIAAPGALAPAIEAALARTRRLVRDVFSLDMRAGVVPIDTLRAQGADLRIAMLELSKGNRIALLSGGGAQLSDTLIKGDRSGTYLLSDSDPEPPDLEGLSCRWEPLAGRYGHMLCLLVLVLAEDPRERARVYGEILADIDRKLSPDQVRVRPVRADNMLFRWPPRGLGLERRATQGASSGWKRGLFLYTQSLVQFFAERNDFRMGNYDPPVYREELRANSDYRRFDDVLRMILDLTPEQHAAIDELLAGAHRRGDIAYGTHCSDAALMTCLLFDLQGSRHIHFIDGTEGGFSYAARGMKAQLAAQTTRRTSGGGA